MMCPTFLFVFLCEMIFTMLSSSLINLKKPYKFNVFVNDLYYDHFIAFLITAIFSSIFSFVQSGLTAIYTTFERMSSVYGHMSSL